MGLTRSRTLLRRIGALILTPAVLVGGLAAATPALAAGGVEFVAAANVYRIGDGLRPVANVPAVATIAAERAHQMAAADTMAHDLDYVMRRLDGLGLCWTGVGEIIAYEHGYPDHSYLRTVDQWWASQGHHDIIVGNYDGAAGAYEVSRSDTTYSVMVFVNLCGASAPSISTPTVVGRTPAADANGVASGASVRAAFSENVAGVDRFSFVLRTAAGTAVPASVSYDTGSRTATLVPASRLGDGTYRASLSSRIFDATGVPLAWTAWSFTVGDGGGTTTVVSAPRATFVAGSHTGYRFSGGSVTGTKTARLAATSGAPTSDRRAIGGKTYLAISDGIWDGYWVPESARVFLPGFIDRLSYATPRRLAFAAAPITGYRYDSRGHVIGSRKITLRSPSGASASARAIINGRLHFLVRDGAWAGYWVPDTVAVSLA